MNGTVTFNNFPEISKTSEVMTLFLMLESFFGHKYLETEYKILKSSAEYDFCVFFWITTVVDVFLEYNLFGIKLIIIIPLGLSLCVANDLSEFSGKFIINIYMTKKRVKNRGLFS